MEGLKERLVLLHKEVDPQHVVYQSKFKDLQRLDDEIRSNRKSLESLNILSAYFNKIVDSKRKEVIDKVINLISYGLQSILQDNSYKLVVKSRIQRNQKFYQFFLEYEGRETPIQDAVGGGIVNLLSFLLRVVLLVVSSNRKFIVLDEPFSALSRNYRENIGQFLLELTEKTGIQIFMVSHQDELDNVADSLYSLKKTSNGVKVIKVR